MNQKVSGIRTDYKMHALSESEAHENAIMQFEKWWDEAVKSELYEVNAMTLATASNDGIPSARIVLLKGFDEAGFVFFSNYDSFKGHQLLENPRACLVFFWKELERQVRITGICAKVDAAQSNDYFNSRPEGSRISALASPQSQPIISKEWLRNEVETAAAKYKGLTINRPSNWGGYIVQPIVIEFWQGRPNRLHDRLQYTIQKNGKWVIERLAP